MKAKARPESARARKPRRSNYNLSAETLDRLKGAAFALGAMPTHIVELALQDALDRLESVHGPFKPTDRDVPTRNREWERNTLVLPPRAA